ncbi:hypothetical protein MRX96_004379 [Rhipicephalus microplus]
MTALEELTAYLLCKAVDIGHFGNVVGSNQSLRTLKVRFQHCCEFKAHKRDRLPQDRNVIKPWVSGLTANHTLERLSMDLSLFSHCECSSFMDAIAVNVSIISVTVHNIAFNGCLREVYSRIRHNKTHQRVVVEDHRVDFQDVEELNLFPEARAVTLSSWHFEHSGALCAAIDKLAVCSHVTSLRLRFHVYDSTLYTAVANYVSATVTVNDIKRLLVARLPEFHGPLDDDMATLHDVPVVTAVSKI